MQKPQSLLELNHIHHELDDLFFLHQAAILGADYSAAKALFRDYEDGLLVHMREEEEILLPLYQQRAKPLRGGDSDFFIQEHGKIVEWLGRLTLRLSRLNPPKPEVANILALLDDEAQYKKYMEHHTLREDRIFYPEVDRVVEAKEKAHLLRLLTFTLEEHTPTV